MSTSLSEKIWQESKLRIVAIIVLPALLASSIVFYAITIGLTLKTSFLANQVAIKVKSSLLDGDWLSSQKIVNKLINEEFISSAYVKIENEYIYGPVGKKQYLSHCEEVTDGTVETQVCSPLLDPTSSYIIVFAFIFSLVSVLVIYNLIKQVLSKQNNVQLKKLKNITNQQISLSENYSTDVSEFQEVEDHLKIIAKQLVGKTKALEMAESAKRYVHDVRSPLLKIRDSLRQTTGGEEAINLVDLLISNAEESLDKLSSKYIPLSDLRNSLDTVIGLYGDKFVKLNLSSSLPGKCWAGISTNELTMVIINLIENSIEASSKQSEISLWETLKDGRSYFKINYSDKGKGLTEMNLNNLNSGKSVVSSKNNGRGIGLSSIYTLLEGLGGNIIYSLNSFGGISADIMIPSHVGENSFEVYYLEDDKFIRETWRQSSTKVNLNLRIIGINEIEKLKEACLPLGSLLFVDYTINGLQVKDLIHDLYQFGYRKIYLASGNSTFPDDIQHVIKGNVGKSPPWDVLI